MIFVPIYWAVTRNSATIDGKWKKRTADDYDGWYDGQYESAHISIDCLTGTFLVNGMTVGWLPERITGDSLFLRVFDHHVFEVQAAESPGTYITKHAYHGDKAVHYEFYWDVVNQRLIVQEQHKQTKQRFELIPHTCFDMELADIFVSNFSHWRNKDNQQIEFRSIQFQDSHFLKDKYYILSIDTGFLTTNSSTNPQLLVNHATPFFQNLF